MNLNTLEKIARQVVKGNNVADESSNMLSKGFITPAEHKSLSSLSFQIAANMRANNGLGAGMYAAALPEPKYRDWI